LAEKSLGSTIIKYEKTLSEKPSSLVFAPLSQAYCEMGLYDKAMNILKKGIRYNPSYVLGYLALAQCYDGQKQHHLAFSTLRPLVAQNRDNIKLQLLFAQISEKTEDYEESLDTYRYLNFLRPNDQEILTKIDQIARKVRQDDEDFTKSENVKFGIEDISLETEAEEWEQVSFVEKKSIEEELAPKDQDDWTTLDSSNSEKSSSDAKDDALFTHTLVDLYLKQGHVERARDILEKILELRPYDKETLDKLASIPSNEIKNSEEDAPSDEGHSDLMASFDKLDDVPLPKKPAKKSSETKNEHLLAALSDFQNALVTKGRDKSIKRK